jgi:hypothetical protein
MPDLREPLDDLLRQPGRYTSHLQFPDPATIYLYDDTLRDGEQMPGVAFSPEQKVELAALLGDIGIDVADVAFPISSASDRHALQLILTARREGRIAPRMDVLAMCRAVPGDIDCVLEAAREAGCRAADVSVLILSTVSDLHLKYKLGRTLLAREGRPESAWLDTPVAFYREANLRLITDAIRYARERGIERIEFAAEDASRGHLDYTLTWAEACIGAGGTRFCFSDTCGVFTPEAVDHYFPPIVEALGVRNGRVQLTAHFEGRPHRLRDRRPVDRHTELGKFERLLHRPLHVVPTANSDGDSKSRRYINHIGGAGSAAHRQPPPGSALAKAGAIRYVSTAFGLNRLPFPAPSSGSSCSSTFPSYRWSGSAACSPAEPPSSSRSGCRWCAGPIRSRIRPGSARR